MRSIALPLVLAVAATASVAADAPLRPEQMRRAMGLKLGEWRTEYTVADVQVEPAPGGTRADAERSKPAIRARLGQPTQAQCLWDDGQRLYLPGIRGMPGCDYSRIEARNGRFAITAVCRQPNSAEVTKVVVAGSYTAEHITARSEATLPIEGMRVRVKLDSKSRFVGECTLPPVILTTPEKGD